MVINPAAGGVGPGALVQAEAILREADIDAEVEAAPPEAVQAALQAAVAAAPDLLIVLAGDGTARAAASLCGPGGPLMAPLPGGTMNMLPHALYGTVGWQAALRLALAEGLETPVSGGEVDGRRFYVAAILGSPALWAQAREAARAHKLQLAWRKARNAWRRAFSSRLSVSLDGGEPRKVEALTLLCPLVSRALAENDTALEAALLQPAGAVEALRIGARALLSDIIGDWRNDPAVETLRCRRGQASASSRIWAILDGEPMHLHKVIDIHFEAVAFRALAPPPERRVHGARL
ncbi:MAG: diacylglycerol kinase family protein [Caulobacteraceae bacterium]